MLFAWLGSGPPWHLSSFSSFLVLSCPSTVIWKPHHSFNSVASRIREQFFLGMNHALSLTSDVADTLNSRFLSWCLNKLKLRGPLGLNECILHMRKMWNLGARSGMLWFEYMCTSKNWCDGPHSSKILQVLEGGTSGGGELGFEGSPWE